MIPSPIVWAGSAMSPGLPRKILAAQRNIAVTAEIVIFLVGHLPAIRPLYGEWARDACLLEAGYIGQTLAQAGLALNIGSCAIGSLDEVRLRNLLGLADEIADVFLHTLLAGPIEPLQQTALAADAANSVR